LWKKVRKKLKLHSAGKKKFSSIKARVSVDAYFCLLPFHFSLLLPVDLAGSKTKISAEDYLPDEVLSRIRGEFVDGGAYSRAQTSEKHHGICASIFIKPDAHPDGSSPSTRDTDRRQRTLYLPANRVCY
jgi:hypothetical protein